MPATGVFFQPDSPCYYGEFPLAFAASTNNIPVFEYLLAAGADLWQQDSNGNNVLHMCVWHKLERMYEFIVSLETQLISKLPEGKKPALTLSQQINKKKHTALLLACYLGDEHEKILAFMLDKGKQTQWTYGPVSCNIYPLDELDTFSEDHKAKKSALPIIVKKRFLKLLMLPRVVDLLHKKWKAYAAQYFFRRCCTTLFYVLALTVAVILRDPGWFNFDDSRWKESYKDARGAWKAISLSIVLLGWLVKGQSEGSELLHSRLAYFQQSGAAFLENTLSACFLIAIPIAIICELLNALVVSDFFVSVAVLFAWGYSLSLLLGFQLTGPFVIMVYKMIVTDVARYIIIYLVILLGFGTAFYAIAEPAAWGKGEWDGIFYGQIYRLFLSMLGGIDFEANTASVRDTYAPWATILYIMYIIVITILLLNLLIAMMGDTFNEIKDQSKEEWHLAYAQIIFSIESELGDDYFRPPQPGKALPFEPYWVTIAGKRYLQIQEVNDGWYADVAKLDGETVDEMLKKFDINADGVISLNEMAAGLAGLRAEGKDLDLVRNPSRDPEPAAKPPILGPQDHLPGRLDEQYSKASKTKEP